MPKKKRRKTNTCTLLICCSGVVEPSQSENFDDFEDTSLARGKILLEKYEESHRHSPQSPASPDNTSSRKIVDVSTHTAPLSQDTSAFVPGHHEAAATSFDQYYPTTTNISKSSTHHERPEEKIQVPYDKEEKLHAKGGDDENTSKKESGCGNIQQRGNSTDDLKAVPRQETNTSSTDSIEKVQDNNEEQQSTDTEEKMTEETKCDGSTHVKKRPTRTDVPDVFVASSDSSLMATFSGSSSELELLKLIELNKASGFNKASDTSEEQQLSGATCNPDEIFMSEINVPKTSRTRDSHVMKSHVPETKPHPLGAASLVLAPIGSSRGTPEQTSESGPLLSQQRQTAPSLNMAEFPVSRRLDFHQLPPSRHIPVIKRSEKELHNKVERKRHSRAELASNGQNLPGIRQACTATPQDEFHPSPTNVPHPPSQNGKGHHRSSNRRRPQPTESSDSSSSDEQKPHGRKSSKSLNKSKAPLAPEPAFYHPTQSKNMLPSININDKVYDRKTSGRKIRIIESSDSSGKDDQQNGTPKTLKSIAPPVSKENAEKASLKSYQERSRRKLPSEDSNEQKLTSLQSAAWDSHRILPSTSTSTSLSSHRIPLFNNRQEHTRERKPEILKTSSLPPPVPPPDQLAPTLFKRRASQGLPQVQGRVSPVKPTSHEQVVKTKTSRAGQTNSPASSKQDGRMTNRVRTKY